MFHKKLKEAMTNTIVMPTDLLPSHPHPELVHWEESSLVF